MKISILSVFPELYSSFLQTSLVHRAQEKKIVSINVESFFSYVEPKKRIDAPTFGPGAGMLIRPEVVERAIDTISKKSVKPYTIFFSPQGDRLDQKKLQQITDNAQKKGQVLLVPSRYEGMDARVENYYADEIVSVGDFVLMGGDLPAMMLIEGMLRLIPGVVGKDESVRQESFYGPFVDYPEFTAPVIWKDEEVPEIVRSGNHKAIKDWRREQAAKKTVLQHFNWLRTCLLTPEDKIVSRKFIPPHYLALMHSDVLIGQERTVGTTSVTSLDIHDIARSSRTYGIKNYFIVTPLVDQQKIVKTLLDFWHTGFGIEYNKSRHEAVKLVELKDSLEQVIATIEKKEGQKPLIIATSARKIDHPSAITFFDQKRVWSENRPILLLLGTGKGLSPEMIERCDYILTPIEGFSDFNHLSVRSAAAIVLDRWLGINERNT